MAEDASAGPSKTSRDSLGSTRAPTPKRSSKREAHSRLRKRRIKLLEKKLELYHRQIRRVTEMEVTLDEMNTRSSAYLKEDWLKRRFLQSWEELCALVGVSPEVQMNDHVYVRPYQGTQFPEVNRRVERLLKLGEFPDHYDVCQLVDRCNEKHSLGMKQEDVMHLSKRLFKEIGNILKKQRIKDLMQHLGCHLTDDAPDDPALSDPVLLQQLSANRHLSQQKLEDVCEKFVDKQEREGDSTASSSDNQEEEEEEYSPRSETERGIARAEDGDRLSGPEQHQCTNGMTDGGNNNHDGRHKDDNSQAGSGSFIPLCPEKPREDSSKRDHTSSEDSAHSPLNSSSATVRQELVPKEEDSSSSGSPPAKRTRLETQTEAVEPCLPADVPSHKDSVSSNRQHDLVVISSEEDDMTKEDIIVVSD